MTPEQEKMRTALLPFIAPSLLACAADAALGALPSGFKVEAGPCGLTDRRGWTCKKGRGHGQRHRYEAPSANPSAHVPVAREWTKVDSVPIKGGSKTFTLAVGGPCSLLPLDSSQQTKHGFKVVSIETHPDGRCNVEVIKPGDIRSRTVPLVRILYRRPKKGVPQ